LAGDIDFQALGDVPLPLAPNSRGEWSLHDHILSHGSESCAVPRRPRMMEYGS
jgi:hypothetical protein